MSGPDWTHDEPKDRDEPGSMSPTAGFDRDQATAPPPEPAMHDDPHAPDGQARPEADPLALDDDETLEPGRPSLLQVAMSLIAKISRASLGSERHEMNVGGPPVEAEANAPSGPERIAPPLLAFLRSRESRVGIVALLSFAVLAGAFIVKKSWTGKTLTMAMSQPGETPTPEDKARDDAEKKKAAETGTGGDPASKDKKGATTPPSGQTPAQTPPAAPVSPEPGLGNPAPAPATVPPPVAEGSEPVAVLGGGAGTLPATLPPPSTTPDGPTPRLPDAPSPGVEPMPEPLPAPMPPPSPSNPAQAPVASTQAPTPEPIALPEPTAPPTGLPPLGEPPAMTPELAPSPETAPAPSSTPAPAPASGPVPTERPPTLETVPPGSLESSATKTSTAGMPGVGGGRWLTIPSGGQRLVGAIPIFSTPAEAQVDAPKVADGPRFADDLAVADQVEPVIHTVEPGENFWTISKLYYRSGRFYKALHAANRKQVPDIRQLWVGTVLRIPPPEALDRSLIEPPDRKTTDDPAPALVRRTTKPADAVDGADLAVPPRRRPVVVDPEAAAAPRRPTYKVKPYETLRSIARDTLNDPRRDREIYNLNRDVLDDINVLPAGTTLTLPTDATVGRRAAR